jgi:hypothetical protein
MGITEPIIIKRAKTGKYVATGRLDGFQRIRKYGRSEDEAMDRFFDACNRVSAFNEQSQAFVAKK